MRDILIQEIFNSTNSDNPFGYLEDKFINIPRQDLIDNIIQFGVLPEAFDHDSSEEKNWAKLSDIILASALNKMNCSADVLRTRGDSADVFGKSKSFSFVADAKTFRLSRTAKNQKDFKVKALSDWKKTNSFAFLVAPLSQYLTTNSQIYGQAIEHNITFLSYSHLKLFLDYGVDVEQLLPLFESPKNMQKSNDAKKYWQTIHAISCDITGVSYSDWEKYKQLEIDINRELGNEGVKYWETKIQEVKNLSREEAVIRVLKSEKLESKIVTIKKVINQKEILI